MSRTVPTVNDYLTPSVSSAVVENLWFVYNVQRVFSQWSVPTGLMEFPSVRDVNLHKVSKGVPCPLGIYSVSWVEQPTMRGCTPGLHGSQEHRGVWSSTWLGLSRVCWRDRQSASLWRETKEGLQGSPWFLFSGRAAGHRILIPWPGWNPCPLLWKPRVLITAPLGKSPVIPFK